jgi:hypothetical protein
MRQPAKCIGILGKLFGHQFHKGWFPMTWTSNYCYRCGMPKSGW